MRECALSRFHCCQCFTAAVNLSRCTYVKVLDQYSNKVPQYLHTSKVFRIFNVANRELSTELVQSPPSHPHTSVSYCPPSQNPFPRDSGFSILHQRMLLRITHIPSCCFGNHTIPSAFRSRRSPPSSRAGEFAPFCRPAYISLAAHVGSPSNNTCVNLFPF